MPYLNTATILGHVGKEPEFKEFDGGRGVANFSVATSERWKDKATSEYKDKTEWHKVVVFNENLIKLAKTHCKKGCKVYAEGALQTRKWTDKAGVEHYTTEIVLQSYNSKLLFLDAKVDGKQKEECVNDDASVLDDEIPF